MRWWNALTEPQRAAAFAAAQTAVPAEAWAHAKRAVLGETGPRVAKVPAIPAVEHRVDVCSRNRDVYPLNGRHRGAGHFCGTTLRTWLGAASLDQDRFESAAGALPVLFGLFDTFGLRADVAAASRPGAPL